MLCAVLRPQETLTYAALLRLPGSMTRKQKYERVDTVMEALGLVKSQNTIIGEHNTADASSEPCCLQHCLQADQRLSQMASWCGSIPAFVTRASVCTTVQALLLVIMRALQPTDLACAYCL